MLTLPEAAALLRLDETVLAAIAEQGEVPGRRLVGEWRFSRAALIAWLAGADRPADCFEPGVAEGVPPVAVAKPDPPPAARPETRMTEQEFAAVTGAGPAAHQPAPRAQREPPPETGRPTTAGPGPDLEPGEFGEAPEAEEARDVALREQAILLRAGELTLEPRLSYARTDDILIKNESFGASLTARYAPIDNLQVEIGLPFRHVERERIIPTQTGSALESSDEDEFGDVRLGATYGLFGEGLWYPSMFVFANTLIPTDGSDAYGLGGGFSLTKTYDPAVLFATFSYLHTFDVESRGPDSRSHDDAFTANLGFAFRVNELLAYSTSVSGLFNPSSDFGDESLGADENYNLELALTWALAENLFVEPSVSFQLNGPADAFAFGLSIPYTFSP